MTKHTPGPWDFRKGDTLNPDRTFGIVRLLSRDECLQIDGDDSGFGGRTEVIAEVTDGTTAEADARLIAAAPELLEALRKADALLKNASTSMGRERTTLPAGNSLLDLLAGYMHPDEINGACDAVIAAIAKATGEDNE